MNLQRWRHLNILEEYCTSLLAFSFFLLLGCVLLSTVFYATEARPLQSSDFSAERFYLTAKKKSGPSPGIGHRYNNVKDLGGVKNSGPSPGEGHKIIYTGNKH
ncbi:hypothetical protein Patl1_35419 [Pistacia atlantica]|nr:hypothetical protein Patl1_35419 [Pistacia atlantica]